MVSPPRRRVVAAPARRPAIELLGVGVFFEPDPFAKEYDFGDRLDEYKRGGFELVYCRAVAEVAVVDVAQTLTSGGLYGIESDSEEEYLKEIVAEQWAQLRDVLKAVGVPTSELPLDADQITTEWRTA